MNPFNLPGPAFLGLYLVLFLAGLVGAAFLRRFLREPSDEPAAEALDLPPYEVAYLRGGEELAVNTAIARLVHQEALAVDASNHKLKLSGAELPPDAPKLEEAVYSAVKGDSGETLAAVRSAARPQLAQLKQRLLEMGLLVAEDQARTARFVPLLLLLLLPLFGTVKIFVGLDRHRPVELLVLLCILSVVVAFWGFGRAVHRSRRGDRVLARLREANAALEFQAGRRVDELAGDDLVLALGLFGMGILAGGRLAGLETALKPPASSGGCGSTGSCGSSCGSGGCGGGCGGGGCGGCGG